MTEENKENENSFDEAIKNINRNLEENLKPIKDGMDNFASKLDSMKKDDKDDNNLDFGDEETYVTKKDLKDFKNSIGSQILSEAKKTSQEVANRTYESKLNKDSRDVEALRDFPLMNQSSSHYDDKFYADVDKEILRRVGGGSSQDEKKKISEDPNLLYDAASNVYSRWVRQGRHAPAALAERETRDLNNREDNFEVKARRSVDSWKPNESQIELANKFGLSKERLTQHFEKIRKSK